MTTANLSVGINTQPAFAALDLLKGELAKLANTSLKLGIGDLRGSVTTALKGTWTINVRTDLERHLAGVFASKTRRVGFNDIGLTADIRKVVESGFTEAKLKFGAANVAAAGQFLRGHLKNSLQRLEVSVQPTLFKDSVAGAMHLALAGTHEQIRAQIAQAMSGVELKEINAKVGVDPTHLMVELRRILAANPVYADLKVAAPALTKTVDAAIQAGFANTHTVRVNTDLISAGVRAAVLGGLASVNTLPKAGRAVRPRGGQLVQPDFTTEQIQREVDQMTQQAQQLLNRAGRRPPSGSDNRKRFDDLQQQISNFRQVEFPKAEAFERAQLAAAKNAVLKLSIDKGHLTAQVGAALAGDHKLTVDLSGLASQIAAVMAMEHRLNIDSSHLARQVAAAVKVGSARGGIGGKLAGPQAAASVASPVFQHAALLEALVPAMDRMVGTIEDSFKGLKSRAIAEAVGTGSAGGSRARGPVFGPDRERLFALRDRDSIERKALDQRSSNETFRARRRLMQQEVQETRAASKALTDADREAQAEAKRLQTELQRDSNATFASKRALWRAEAAEARAAARALTQADREAQAEAKRLQTESQRDSNATFASKRALWRAEAAEARLRTRALLKEAEFEASAKYTPRGARIAAAQVVAARPDVGPAAVGEALGVNRHLLGQTQHLNSLRRGLKETTGAGHQFNDMQRQVHSGARGLAGAMGQMWLTWGSTVPLIAGAALGATLRSVFMVGKDLEYQLKFVSVLSEGATVSMTAFGDAVRGTQVAPVEAAKALRGLAQNGLDAQQALMALPAILNLATAGEMDLMDAALGATGVMAAFNLQVTDLGHIGDVFARAAASSNTSVSSMVESMRQASVVSDQYKVSLEETAASLAVLAKRNIVGSAAGTAFRNMMSDMSAPSDKAREAMKKLGMQLFDNNGQLKGYRDVLLQLRDATINLNEKGRLAFLGQVFDERGAKSANALIADYKLFGETLDDLNTKSAGFAQTVVQALGETTTGKIKRMVAEFQLSAAAAFNEVETGAKNFVDALRVALSSDSFRSTLSSLSSGVVSLTRYLVDHADAVLMVASAWLGLKVLNLAAVSIAALIPAVGALGAELKVLQVSLLGVTISARAAWAALTGGLTLVIALVAQYFLLRTETNAAAEAAEAHRNALRLQNDDIERQGRTMEESNKVLREEVRLMWLGADAITAKRQAQKNLASETIKADRTANDTGLADVQGKLAEIRSKPSRSRQDYRDLDSLLAQERKLLEGRQDLNRRDEGIRKADTEAAAQAALSRQSEVLHRLKKYNDDVAAINAKGKHKLPLLDQNDPSIRSVDQIDEAIKRKEAEKNRILGDGGFSVDKGSAAAAKAAAAAARRERLSLARQEIEDIKRDADEIKHLADQQGKLDDLRYSSDRYGPYLAALVAEQRAIDNTSNSIAFQEQALLRLDKLKRGLKANDPDRINLETKAAEIEASLQRERQDQYFQQQRRQQKARNSDEKDADEFNSALKKVRVQGTEDTRTLEQKYRAPTLGPVEKAGEDARIKVQGNYLSLITSQQDKVDKLALGLQRAREELVALSDAEQVNDPRTAVLAGNQAALTIEQARLSSLRSEAAVRAQEAADMGAAHEAASRTASAGWDRFWKEYEANGRSKADSVIDALKGVTSAAENAWMEFGRTGKLSIKGILDSIRDSLFKQVFDDSIKPLLGQGLKSLGGLFGLGNAVTAAVDPVKVAQDAATVQSTVSLTTMINWGVNPATAALQGFTLALNAAAASSGSGGGSGGIAGLIGGWFGAGGGGDGTGVGIPGIGDGGALGFPFANGDAFGLAGLHKFAKGGAFTNAIISSPTLFRFAQGGAFGLGQMGEAGDEAVMPLERGPGGKLGVANYGGGRQAPVTNITIVGAPAGSKVERKKNGTGGEDVLVRFKESIKQDIADDVDNGVGLARNVGSRFGLNSGVGLVR